MTHTHRIARILLVEDNPTDVLLTERALSSMDIEVQLSVANDGEIAMEMLFQRGGYSEAELPDLILLDINMPRKDGLQVLSEIKAAPELRHLPVMMLTTSDSPSDIHKAYSLFANAYAAKPSQPAAFRDMVKTIESFWFEAVLLPKQS